MFRTKQCTVLDITYHMTLVCICDLGFQKCHLYAYPHISTEAKMYLPPVYISLPVAFASLRIVVGV